MTDRSNQPAEQPVTVMIVEDSHAVRLYLEEIINRDPRLKLLASVESGEKALHLLETMTPDVISLDIRLPGINGFDVTRRVMSTKPTPIVVCSASVQQSDLMITMNALRAGALSVVEKPVSESHRDYVEMAERLCTQLVAMSRVKVIRQWPDRREKIESPATDIRQGANTPTASEASFGMVGIVASTGGPNALTAVLSSLHADYPIPICVVQHITPSFSDGFIEWLGSMCTLKVLKTHARLIPQPGHVYVAPAERQLVVETGCLCTEQGSPGSKLCPSGDVLLGSMARAWGRHAIGIVLTGMGEDGARGLLALRSAGGYTIAEDSSTAVVFGMPGAAQRLGAACELLPLSAIGPRLVQLAVCGNNNCERNASQDSFDRRFSDAGYASA